MTVEVTDTKSKIRQMHHIPEPPQTKHPFLPPITSITMDMEQLQTDLQDLQLERACRSPEELRTPYCQAIRRGLSDAQGQTLTACVGLYDELEKKAKDVTFRQRIVKVAKVVVGVGLFITGLVLAPTGVGLVLFTTAAMAWTVAVAAYESHLSGGLTTAGGAGTFVFNVLKGGVMTALGIEGIASAADSAMDIVCGTMVDMVDNAHDISAVAKENGMNAQLLDKITLQGAPSCTASSANCVVTKEEISEGLQNAKSHAPAGEQASAVEQAITTAGQETLKWISCGVWRPSADFERTKELPKGVKIVEYPHLSMPMPKARRGPEHWHDEEDDEE